MTEIRNEPENSSSSDGCEPALEKLNRPGWERVYEVVGQAIEEWHAEAASNPKPPHFVLLGNPGTGKTTIARLIGEVLHEHGILKSGSTVEVTCGNLLSPYVGDTPRTTMACVNRAEEGVLFIDEAHFLAHIESDNGTEEVLSTLVSAMTDDSQRFSLVLAGYEKETRNLLDLNVGLRRRIADNHIIVIDDFGPEVLYAILHEMMERELPARTTDQETDRLLQRACEYIYVSRTAGTGNAGRMERLFHEMDRLRRERCVAQGIDCESPERYQFVPSDIPADLIKQLSPDYATTEELMAELDALVGLDDVKAEIKNLIKHAYVYRERAEKGLKQIDFSMHMVFVGNPGTGKTTVARLVGGICQSMGLLPRGQVVEVDRGKLVGNYIGQTAIKTQEQIDKALGGVLFVDEAHALAPSNIEHGFGSEAIDTILKAMEDNRDNLVVILAGYTEPMRRLVFLNPGLERRFKTIIGFPDYTADECLQILEGLCHRSQYELTDEAREAARQIIENEIADNPSFSNGRFVRNLFEGAVSAQSVRLASVVDPTDEDFMTLAAEDFAAV